MPVACDITLTFPRFAKKHIAVQENLDRNPSLWGSASSAHTDLTHLRTHILSALAPHLRTQLLTQARTESTGETQVRTQALSRMLTHLKGSSRWNGHFLL